jgi:hypothetical protein
VRDEPEGDFRNIEDRFALPGFGDAQDVLSGGDDLAGFGVDRSNDPVDLRMKLRVAEIFLSEHQLGPGRIALCLGRFAGRGLRSHSPAWC